VNISYLNAALKGKRIESIEAGHTPGWIVIHIEDKRDDETRLYLTAFCGGDNEIVSSDDRHTAVVAVHVDGPAGHLVDNVRDDRDPQMRLNFDGWKDWQSRIWENRDARTQAGRGESYQQNEFWEEHVCGYKTDGQICGEPAPIYCGGLWLCQKHEVQALEEL